MSVPDTMTEYEQKLFIQAKMKMPEYVWYMHVDNEKFDQNEAEDALDFEYNIHNTFYFEEIGETEAEFIISTLTWDEMSIGQKLFVVLVFPAKMLNKYLFEEKDARILNLIKKKINPNFTKSLIIIP